MTNKPVLCPAIDCTGCQACSNICPKDCIAMESDSEGFLRPVIDFDQCVECRKCEQCCPILNIPKLDHSHEPAVYAGWHQNEEIRMKSSSGGAFSAMAEVVLEQGGVVFGAAYDDDLYVRHRGIEKIEDLDKLRRSKYVQSEIGDSFRQVKQYLENDRKVLFVGTPCQVSGLAAFLGKEYDNLLAVDFVCHGASSPVSFNKYIKYLECHYETKLVDINFRDKRNGWKNNAVVALSSDNHEYHAKGKMNSYYRGFILSMSLRESCYKCKTIGLPRQGDMTIADFWGIKMGGQITQKEIDKGISLVMLNHSRALKIIKELKQKMIMMERSFEEAKAGNSPMCTPSLRPIKRNLFFKDLWLLPYDVLSQRYLRFPLKKRIVQFLKDNLGSVILAKLRYYKQIRKWK